MTDYELKPLVPMDLPEEVWKAVAANYGGDWSPAPECHAEYRDARVAVETYKARLRKILFEDATLNNEYRMQRLLAELSLDRT